eukprot:50379-Pyramimonas_sp.AAC.1
MDYGQCVLMLPGLILGVGLYFAVIKIPHYSVLPVVMGTSIAAFYVILLISGTSLQVGNQAYNEI